MKFLLASIFFIFGFGISPLFSEEVPLSWREHFEKGIEHFEKGFFDAALSSFEKASAETDHEQLIYFNRALAHQMLGEEDLAEEHYQNVLHEDHPLLSMKAHYQMGHLFFERAMNSGNNDSQDNKIDLEELEDSSFHFRECMDLFHRNKKLVGSEGEILHDKAESNNLRIAARYKYLMDQMSKERGEKTRLIQGTVEVNGRPVDKTRVYIKSKWENRIYGHTFSDNTGGYRLEDLPVGKYLLAAALYDTDDIEDLEWNTEVKVPTRTEDTHDLKIQGAQTLAIPYQSSSMSLPAPWDDHLREGGGESLITAPHWGELTDGFPETSLSSNTDLDIAYVAFDTPRIQIGIPVPELSSQDGAPQPQAGDNVQPPKFEVTLKGFASSNVAMPSTLRVFGFAPPKEDGSAIPPPVELTVQPIELEQATEGTYKWTSEPFEHKGLRSLALDLERTKGQRMSFHEIEVREILDQQGDQNQDQEQEGEQNPQENNDDQNQQEQRPEEKKEETSRSTRAILQDIRKKNEDAKERQMDSGIIISTEKDF